MTQDVPFKDFSDDECLEHFASRTFGRLAFSVGGTVEIFPVNYYLVDRKLLFRTAPGTKLAGTVISSDVAFQVDSVLPDRAWSVIAHGRARHLEHGDEIDEAAKLPLKPWVPTVKLEFVEIAIERMSGREYRLGPEPLPEPELIS